MTLSSPFIVLGVSCFSSLRSVDEWVLVVSTPSEGLHPFVTHLLSGGCSLCVEVVPGGLFVSLDGPRTRLRLELGCIVVDSGGVVLPSGL